MKNLLSTYVMRTSGTSLKKTFETYVRNSTCTILFDVVSIALAVARAASNSGPFCVYFFNNVKGTCFGSVR